MRSYNARGRRTGIYHGVGASCPGSLRPFALLRSHATMPAYPDLRIMGDATGGSPIPLHAGIKAHSLCEKNSHLQHIQRLSARYSALQFRWAGLAYISPLQGGPAFLLPAPRPDALSPLPAAMPVRSLVSADTNNLRTPLLLRGVISSSQAPLTDRGGAIGFPLLAAGGAE
jgi:hypothetical protein